MRFTDKLMLVTGGASGIGRATAGLFVEEGATVIVTDRDSSALAAMTLAGPGCLVTRESDAASPAAIAELASWVTAEYGRLDVLVNNAGFAVMSEPEGVNEAQYQAQMNVLLTGPVFYVKHFAALLRQSVNGAVVNIASGSAVISAHGYCPYALAKAALVKFSEDSAIQVPGVRHNAVLPGFIETPILAKAYGEEPASQLGELLNRLEPVGRIGQPQDIAHAVAFLASAEASYINGTSLLVDGGMARLNTAASLAAGAVQLA